MSPVNEFLDNALSLSSDQRADLAYHLILSLDAPDFAQDVSPQWIDEIQRRRERYLRGKSKCFDAAETLQRIEQRLDGQTGSQP